MLFKNIFPYDNFSYGPIFTIIAIKGGFEVTTLLTYDCIPGNGTCKYDRDPENIPISEGDIINIRTERNFNQKDIRISHLFTFLLELDPL